MYHNVEMGIIFDDESEYTFKDFLVDSGYHEWELMQYTSLLDKNGKEIYEGDICSVDWNDKRYPVHNTGPVTWDKRNACWQLGEGGEPQSDAKNHFEVISNVMENPELLNQ